MKDLLLALVTCVVVGVPLAVGAQAPARPPRPIWRELGLSEARTVLGMRIKNEQGRDVGELDNLLIDTQSGRISHVVIGVGGFMGVGEKKVASEGNHPVATLEQAKLESAPRWDRIVSDEIERPSASPTTTR